VSLTAYCPTCAQDALTMDDGRCAWCDTPTRRRPGKPAGKWGKLTDEQIRAAHLVYVERGLSMRKLGALLCERFGFASAQSCSQALWSGFQRLALPARDRIEATVAASTTHGRGARRDQAAYKRWRREQQGYRPRCAGLRAGHPRKGEPCARPAMVDSDYCLNHDPARRPEVLAHVRAARDRLGAA
jgi:hypothetical protein